jgi:hypothetical protein
MPCNETIVKRMLRTRMSDLDILKDALDDLGLNYGSDSTRVWVFGNQELEGVGRVYDTITFSLKGTDDKPEISVEAEDRDMPIVEAITQAYTRRAVKREIDKRKGKIVSEERNKAGSWIVRAKAKATDQQTLQLVIGKDGTKVSISGGDLDVCNPLSHSLQHAIEGSEADHTHDWGKMGYTNWETAKPKGQIKLGGGWK